MTKFKWVGRARGASRTSVEKPLLATMFMVSGVADKPKWWPRYGWWGLAFLVATVVAIMLSAELMAQSQDDSHVMFPLAKVEVTGDLHRLDHQRLRTRLLPATTGGFFDVDVLGIRQIVEQIPWVKDVQISRRWPDQLVININERQPLARWGEMALLDQSGERFAVERLDEFVGLPGLSGPEGSEQRVTNGLRFLLQALAELPGGVNQVALNGRDEWRVSGSDGVVITFSGNPQQAPLKRLIQVYRQELIPHWGKVSSVDLRYSDGLAVAFTPNTIQVEQGTRR